MAWIESHQALDTSPKLKRAARRLGVSRPTVSGHLHFLWHWALDNAFDGDLSDLDVEDIADAAEWTDDPVEFVSALTECGPGDQAGFLERDGLTADGHRRPLVIHDWFEHTKHLRERREASIQANHQRWHVKRGVVEPSCGLCCPAGEATEKTDDPPDIPPDSAGTPTGDAEDIPPESTDLPYLPEPTDPKRPDSLRSPDDDFPDGVCQLTRRLATAVVGNGHKTPPAGSKAAYRWFEAIDKLLRLDQADPDEVAAVIDWATADEFWAANIRSAGKLRDQYSRLRLQRRSKQTTNGRHGGVTRLEDGRELAY